MSLLRHRQRGITSVSPHPNNASYVIPSRVGREEKKLSYEESAALMQLVYETAGVGAGVAPGADPLLIAAIPPEPDNTRSIAQLTPIYPVLGYGTSQDWQALGFRNVYIRNEGDAQYFSAITHNGTTSGLGTKASPYLIDDCLSANGNLNGDTASGSAFLWDDPTANYHVKVTNSYLWNNTAAIANATIRVNVPAGQTITFDNCDIYCSVQGAEFIRIEGGTLKFNIINTTDMVGSNHVQMAGPNTVFEAVNWKVEDVLNALRGRFLATSSAATGCRINLTNVSYLPVNLSSSIQVCQFFRDLTLTIDACVFSSKATTDLGDGIINFWSTTDPIELCPLPKIIRDSEIYCGAGKMLAAASVVTDFFYTNVLLERSFFYHNNAPDLRMIECGPSPEDTTTIPDKWKISWCRFEKVNESQLPGNEVLYLLGTENCIVENCWADAAPEDSYELYSLRDNNTIRYCGVGNPAGTEGAWGQAAEMFLAADNLPTSGNVMHDLWGHCGGEGALVTNISNVKTWNILTKGDADIYAPTPPDSGGVAPAANVSIAHRFVSQLTPTGCENTGFTTQDSESTGGKDVIGAPTAWAEVGQDGQPPPTGNTDTAERKPALTPA